MTPRDLRGSILSLVVQGKLVEQRSEDGTAAALYQQLKAEKQKQIKIGKIGKSKSLVSISENDILFEIPESWEWIKIGDIAAVVTKGTTPRGGEVSYLDKGIGFLRAENVAGYDKLEKSTLKYIDEETHVDYLKRSILQRNDILVTIAGTLGRTAIAREEDLPLNANQAVSIIRLVSPEAINLLYLIYALNSSEIQKYLTGQKKITAIPNLTLEIIENCVIPLPPLAEQKRIVAKIEELLPFIESYEQAWSKLEDLNKRFPTDMQKSILQYAIQGKLVKQRSDEGTGEELYQQIQVEKQRLVKAGKIKKEKPLPEITEDEKPFDIPESWKWVRMSDITENIGDGIHGTPNYDMDGKYYFINGNNLDDGIITFKADTKRVNEAEYEKHKKPLTLSTILISINGTIGNIAYYNDELIILGKSACYISLVNYIYKQYIRILLESKHFLNYASKEATQTTIKNVSLKAIRMLPVPLPPLAEQRRIVAKLEEILPLCEKLKR